VARGGRPSGRGEGELASWVTVPYLPAANQPRLPVRWASHRIVFFIPEHRQAQRQRPPGGEIEHDQPAVARLRPRRDNYVSQGGRTGRRPGPITRGSSAAAASCAEAEPSRAIGSSRPLPATQARLPASNPITFRRSSTQGPQASRACEGGMEVFRTNRGGGQRLRPARRCRRNRSPRCRKQAAAEQVRPRRFAPGETPAAPQHPVTPDRQLTTARGQHHLAHGRRPTALAHNAIS